MLQDEQLDPVNATSHWQVPLPTQLPWVLQFASFMQSK